MRESSGGPASALVRSLVVGLCVAALALGIGLAYSITRDQNYRAAAAIVVLPKNAPGQPDTEAGLYDTLSQGQIPATYAELLRARGERLTGRLPTGVSVTVDVLPDTSVLRVAVTAPSKRLAEAVVGASIRRAQVYLSTLRTPYRAEVVDDGRASATAVGPGSGLLLGVVVVVALLLGVVGQQLAAQVFQMTRA